MTKLTEAVEVLKNSLEIKKHEQKILLPCHNPLLDKNIEALSYFISLAEKLTEKNLIKIINLWAGQPESHNSMISGMDIPSLATALLKEIGGEE